MSEKYFKYKALSLDTNDFIDKQTLNQVINPIVDSYYYLSTRERLNDPNEGLFKSSLKNEISLFLSGLSRTPEKHKITQAFLQFEDQLNQSTDKSGIFSLSHTATDELMWAHYCASHCGIVLEYDISQLTRFSSSQHLHTFKVNYSSKPPHLSLHDIQNNPIQVVATMLGYKSPKWSYENEFRVLLENINGRVPHDYRAVKSITFGLNVPEATRKQIFELTKHKVPNYYEINQIKDSYDLDRVLLSQYVGSSLVGKKCEIDWEKQFEFIKGDLKNTLIHWAKREIENDPHFNEFWMAERSTIDKNKAVLQYETSHYMGLTSSVSNTKVYYKL